MHFFSQSAFMQALGWATLNSFWQTGLLWFLYLAVASFFKLSSAKRYSLALAALISSFGLFIATFCFYRGYPYQNYSAFAGSFLPQSFLDKAIYAASCVYLILLCIPLYNFYKNWQYLQAIKTKHLSKASYTYRLFVNKVALQLGIKRPVHVYISQLIKSPVTVGYLKPIILLPIASLNNLSLQQAEAILLHELSHIKRGDYLINLIVAAIHTLLYFNPFVRSFVKVIEAERETCCDQTVLQFQYDRISYATALLVLERHSQSFLIAATGKNNLLYRVQHIMGIEVKPRFKFTQVVSFISALLFIVGLNAILIFGKGGSEPGTDVSYSQLTNPFYFFDAPGTEEKNFSTKKVKQKLPIIATDRKTVTVTAKAKAAQINEFESVSEEIAGIEPLTPADLVKVKFNLANNELTTVQKEKVKATVKTTKDILSKLEWKELEKTIADGLTKNEKAVAKQQYLNEIQNLNWQKLEIDLTNNYNTIDWNELTTKITGASVLIKLDSLQTVYNNIVSQVNNSVVDSLNCKIMAIPGVSKENLIQIQGEAKKRLNIIKAIRNRKVVRL